jgi:hypothetical protein
MDKRLHDRRAPSGSLPRPCSALMVAAVKAFHREELRWIKPEQVFRTTGNPCLRIWSWASKRWGMRWQRLEFDMRNKPNAKSAATGSERNDHE